MRYNGFTAHAAKPFRTRLNEKELSHTNTFKCQCYFVYRIMDTRYHSVFTRPIQSLLYTLIDSIYNVISYKL